MKRRVFIVSSKEGLDVARAMQSELDNWAETTIWSQAVFTPSSTALDDLIRISGGYDFGVFVFSFEDIVKIRDQEYRSTRDNVVFELGIFIGRLGKERTFLVTPETQNNFHLPTDLIGLTCLTFDSERTDGNLQAALGPACTRIIERIRKISASALLIKERQEESDNLLKIIRRIVELHQVAYSEVLFNDWTVVHSIDENGTDHLHEEFTLIPEAEPLYFYLLESNYLEREHESTMDITARNGGSGVPLSLLQLGRSRGIVSHAVVLDPPATKKRPQRVVIDCQRQSMWKDLIEKGADQGVLRVTNKTDLLRFEFRAPQGRSWKGLNPTPEVGQITVTPASVIWEIPEPNTGRFSFKLFLE